LKSSIPEIGIIKDYLQIERKQTGPRCLPRVPSMELDGMVSLSAIGVPMEANSTKQNEIEGRRNSLITPDRLNFNESNLLHGSWCMSIAC